MAEGAGQGGVPAEIRAVGSLQRRIVEPVLPAGPGGEGLLQRPARPIQISPAPEAALQIRKGIQRGDQLLPGAAAEVLPGDVLHQEPVRTLRPGGAVQLRDRRPGIPQEGGVYLQLHLLGGLEHALPPGVGHLPDVVVPVVLLVGEGRTGRALQPQSRQNMIQLHKGLLTGGR